LIRVLLLLFLLLITIEARENPFFPSEGEKDISNSSNIIEQVSPLKRSSITLPSSARKIKKVTIEYINMDASIAKQTIELDNTIDWHLPIFISQNYSKIEKKQNSQYKKIASIKYAKFFSLNKRLKIITNDTIIRNFLLTNPHRIVVDFKRDANLKSFIKNNRNSPFKKIRIGNHSGYYRAVIELDGHYRYTMKKVSNGYLFVLR